jgi:hypothetical protein
VNKEKAFAILVATAIKFLVDESEIVAHQAPPARKNQKRRVRSPRPPAIDPVLPGMGDEPIDFNQAFSFLDANHVRTPPPPPEDEQRRRVPPGYSPSRETDETGTQDTLTWMNSNH